MPFSLEYGEGLFEEVTLKLWLEGQERTGHSCYKGNAPRRAACAKAYGLNDD